MLLNTFFVLSNWNFVAILMHLIVLAMQLTISHLVFHFLKPYTTENAVERRENRWKR